MAGVISGTPTTATSYTVTVTVSDRPAGDPLLLTATQTYTLTVASNGTNQPPTFTSLPSLRKRR